MRSIFEDVTSFKVHTRTRRLLSAIVGLSLVLTVFDNGPKVDQAGAHTFEYGFWNCWQQSTLNAGDIRVGHTNLPVDGWGDGVKNSFVDRAIDATNRVGTALAARNPSGNGMTWIGTNTGRHIVFSVEQLGVGVLGEARVGAGCTSVHGSKVPMPVTVGIALATRSDWFAQDDSRRLYWEACPGSSYSSGYTCSKTVDVGSTMIHELGHAIGLAHPRQVVNDGHGSGTLLAADCFVTLDQATMCQAGDLPGGGKYRSHRRTLHAWDLSSIGFHY